MSERRKILLGLILFVFLTSIFTGAGWAVRQSLRAGPPRTPGHYDYEALVAKGYDWVGPMTGDVLDLKRFFSSGDQNLSEAIGNDYILLSVVDSECKACSASKDQFKFFSNYYQGTNIDYYVVSFTRKQSPHKFDEYVSSFGVSSSGFLWRGDVTPESILKMVLPSHILLDRNGKVIKTFPGTSNHKDIRGDMAQEIITQTAAHVGERP